MTDNLIIQQFLNPKDNLVQICFILKLPQGLKVEFAEPVLAKYLDYVIADFKQLYNL